MTAERAARRYSPPATVWMTCPSCDNRAECLAISNDQHPPCKQCGTPMVGCWQQHNDGTD